MKEHVEELRNSFEADLQNIAEAADFQRVRDSYFSRKSGRVTLLMKELGKLSSEDRREAGRLINEFKDYAESRLEACQEHLKKLAEAAEIERTAGLYQLNRDELGQLLYGKETEAN